MNDSSTNNKIIMKARRWKNQRRNKRLFKIEYATPPSISSSVFARLSYPIGFVIIGRSLVLLCHPRWPTLPYSSSIHDIALIVRLCIFMTATAYNLALCASATVNYTFICMSIPYMSHAHILYACVCVGRWVTVRFIIVFEDFACRSFSFINLIRFFVFFRVYFPINQKVIKGPMKNVYWIIFWAITIHSNDLFPTKRKRWVFDSDWRYNKSSMW